MNTSNQIDLKNCKISLLKCALTYSQKASDSIETDAWIKEVYTEKIEKVCNKSLHSNIEYFQDIDDNNCRL